MINIILADDHSIVREGLRKLVEQLENVSVVKTCGDGLEVIDYLQTHDDIDIVISDFKMPQMDGLNLTSILASTHPKMKIILLSMYDNLSQVILAFQTGVSAYLLKSAEIEEIAFAIKMVVKNRRYIGTELAERMLDNQLQIVEHQESEDLNHYTERELEVLTLIAEGLTNLEISSRLFLSKRTVEGHRQNLLQKTGSKNTATLVRYAIKNKMIN